MVGSRQRCETLVSESSAPAGFEAYPYADSLNSWQARAALAGDRVEMSDIRRIAGRIPRSRVAARKSGARERKAGDDSRAMLHRATEISAGNSALRAPFASTIGCPLVKQVGGTTSDT
jgi:hypothetical protein